MKFSEIAFDTSKLNKEYSNKIQDIARDFKGMYAEFLDEYGRDKKDYWWISPIVSRNISWDITYQNICELLLCIEVLNSTEYGLVVVSNKQIKIILHSLYPDKRIVCKRTTNYIRLIFDRMSCFFGELISFINYSFIKPLVWKMYGRKKKYPMGEVLVVQPLLSNMISNDGSIQERYVGGLNDYTNESIDFYYQLNQNENISCRTLVEKCNKIRNNSVFDEEIYSIKDIIVYVKYRRYLKKLAKDRFIFNGINISPIIKESLYRSAKMYRVAYTYSISKRFFKSHHYKYVLIWYEGRPTDNAIALALNSFSFESIDIGVIQYPLSEFTFCAMNTKGQIERHACPTTVSVTGESFVNQVRQMCDERKVIIFPYLRKKMRYVRRKEGKKTKLFVALPYFKKDCQVILDILDKFIERTTDRIEIVLKMHPVFEEKDVSIYTEKKLSFIPKYVTGDIYDCLEGASIAVSSNSSASMDIICSGIPLICVNPLGEISDTWIPGDVPKELYFLVYDIYDFEKAYYKIKSNIEFIRIDIQNYFVTPTAEMINNILKK